MIRVSFCGGQPALERREVVRHDDRHRQRVAEVRQLHRPPAGAGRVREVAQADPLQRTRSIIGTFTREPSRPA